MDEVEQVWLKSNPYLVGDKISVADLIGLCEMDQSCKPSHFEFLGERQTALFHFFIFIVIAGYNSAAGRSKIAAWQKRVRKELEPHYDDVTSFLRKVVKKFQGNPLMTRKNW